MIINEKINHKNIYIKKEIKYLNNFSFFPINYDNEYFLIQTPKLFIPFQINIYNNKKYLHLSIHNLNDSNIENFKNNLDIPINQALCLNSNRLCLDKSKLLLRPQ